MRERAAWRRGSHAQRIRDQRSDLAGFLRDILQPPAVLLPPQSVARRQVVVALTQPSGPVDELSSELSAPLDIIAGKLTDALQRRCFMTASPRISTAPIVADRRLLADISPLRESPDYRRLWLGSMLSSAGGQITTFAVALQVFRISHSSAAVGGVGLAFAIPAIAVGMVAGVLIDSADRRRLVLVTSSVDALVSAGFIAQAFAGTGAL